MRRRELLTGALGLGIGSMALAGCSTPSAEQPLVGPSGDSSSAEPPSVATESSAPTTSGASTSPSATPSVAKVGRTQQLAGGLTSPWGLRAVDNDTLLVGERDTGKIKVVRSGAVAEFATIAESVPNNEAGLLGFDLSHDHRTMFVYFSTARDNRVAAYDFSPSGLTNGRTILTGLKVAPNHNGGQVRVGPDQKLYVAVGDARNSDAAQSKASLNGKILRLNPDGTIPSDNPFGNAIWSMGHRNIQGLAFDTAGRLWATEFGDKATDEINLIERGHNYGWPVVEGGGSRQGMTEPKATWSPTSKGSPSGLAFVAGSLWAGTLQGQALVQFATQNTSLQPARTHFAKQFGRIRAVEAYRGNVVFTTSNTDGRGEPTSGDDRLMLVELG